MKSSLTKFTRKVGIPAMFAALCLLGNAALAAPHREDHRRYDPPRYASPHWHLDARYQHNRYYPARGYVVGSLPPGHLSINFGGGRYYHHGGVWFRNNGARFVVVAPPLGIVVPFLPFGYVSLRLGGIPYYYADDVYYSHAPQGGYVVVAPPPQNEVVVEQAPQGPPPLANAPAAAAANATPTPSGGQALATGAAEVAQTPAVPPASVVTSSGALETLYIYPRAGQNPTQASYDRIECEKWASEQTGYNPTQSVLETGRRSNYQRAASACLEARGYAVK